MRITSMLVAVCCWLSAVSVQQLEAATQPVASVRPGFDPSEVVRQVRPARPGPSAVSRELSALDDGEFLIDTSITYVPAPGSPEHPAVAFDGTNFLVVWADYNEFLIRSIYCARVTPQGTVLDPAGIIVSAARDSKRFPAVAFDGANFLVVWTDTRSGTCDIYGARVTSSGVVLDSLGIAISTTTHDEGYPAVGFDGVNSLVVWADYRGGSSCDIYGTRVTPGGAVLDSTGIAISTAACDAYTCGLGFDGTNFLVVWTDARRDTGDIYGARVTPGGVVLDSAGIAISTATHYQRFPALGFDGANFLVVWEDYRSDSLYDVYGARVTPGGGLMDPTGIAISTVANIYPNRPALGFDGANFLVAWSDKRSGWMYDIYGARVTPGGVVLDPAGIAISTAAYWKQLPAIAFDGENSLVVWDGYDQVRGLDVHGARVSQAGVVLDPDGIAISTAANFQGTPAVSFDSTNFLVVWEDFRSGYYSDLYGARVTPGGEVLDPTGIAISTAAAWQRSPVLGFDGTNFLAVWEDVRSGIDIYGARVSVAGVVLDPDGIVISTGFGHRKSPAVSFDGTNFLAVWKDYRNELDTPDVYGARVSQAGVVLDPNGRPIAEWEGRQLEPAVSFDGTNFLVVWRHGGEGAAGNIYGARVSQDGTVLEWMRISSRPADEPDVSFDGTDFLVAWLDYGGGDGGDIYGARVSQAGVVLDSGGIAISTAVDVQRSPVVSFDGTNFLVVWTDRRNDTYSSDLHGARVTPAGVVFDEGPVARQEGQQRYPALASGLGGRVLLAYEGWAGTVGGKTYNTYRTWVKLDPQTGIAEATNAEVRTPNLGPTIVRGCFVLPQFPIPNSQSRVGLLDISGRKVLDLKSGLNDVRSLAPGVYFVREEPQAASYRPQAVRKVIVQH